MDYGDTDAEVFSFLPLCNVKSVSEELVLFAGIPDYSAIAHSLPDYQDWFVIIDYLIYSAVFAVRLTADAVETPVLVIHDGRRFDEVAASFEGFLEAYLTDRFDLIT